MSNVIKLFGQDEIEHPLDSESVVTLAVADILVSHAELARHDRRAFKLSRCSRSCYRCSWRPPAPARGSSRTRSGAALV